MSKHVFGDGENKSPHPAHAMENPIGRRIREARVAAKLSQEDLAKAVASALGEKQGRTRAGISSYETKGIEPPRKVLEAIAQATGHRYEWLRTGEEPKLAQNGDKSEHSPSDTSPQQGHTVPATNKTGDLELREAESFLLEWLREKPKAAQRYLIRAALRQLERLDEESDVSGPRRRA